MVSGFDLGFLFLHICSHEKKDIVSYFKIRILFLLSCFFAPENDLSDAVFFFGVGRGRAAALPGNW